VKAGDTARVRSLIDGDLATTYNKHREAINGVVTLATDFSAKAERSASDKVHTGEQTLFVTIAIALLGSALLAWFIVRNLSRQLRGASTTLTDATDRLRESNVAIRSEAAKTARQSADVAATGDSVTDGISTIAAACDELTASITEISRAASEAVSVANEAVAEADAAVTMVSRLDASSMEITNVVELISTIAEQTNLLALNATIEAARAGDMGRGFAVVANEVKELANKTSIATGEISEKIRNVQMGSASAIDSIRRVADIVSQINGIQTTVAGAVEEQVATTNEIARSLNEAASGTSVVTDAIGAVAASAEGVETNVATAEDVSVFLGDFAAELRQLVGTAR
jgi:methyl-accepting chemotaxis protein